jgi:transposase
MAYQRVEILTGTERRRNYTPAEKVRIVEEAFRLGVIVKDVARRLGIHESLLYRWRRLMRAASPTGGLPTFVPVMVTPDPDMVEPSVLPSATSPPATPTAVAGAVLDEPRRVYQRPHFLRDWGHHDEADITQIRP